MKFVVKRLLSRKTKSEKNFKKFLNKIENIHKEYKISKNV